MNLTGNLLDNRGKSQSARSREHAAVQGRHRLDRITAGAAKQRNWSEIALEAGYFDQAHLIGDFKSLTGLTPMSVFSNTRA